MDARLISEAVTAARRALRELEPDEIPARLRKAASSSARRLPVPLERALVAALDEHDWLRDKARQELPESAGLAARLFLERPEGWESEFSDLQATGEASLEERSIDALAREVAALTVQRDRARAKAKSLQAALENERREHRATLAQARQRPDVAPRSHERGDVEKRVNELAAENDLLAGRLADSDRRLTRIRAELLKARRAAPTPFTNETFGLSVDPLSLGRTLDRITLTARPDAVPAPSPDPLPPPDDGDLSLGLGIAPDSPEAISYVLDRTAPTLVIVDGYNVSFHVDPVGFSTAAARAKVAAGLSRMSKIASGPMRIMIVWDSTEEATEGPAAPSVERKFVADADEEVRELSHQAAGNAVVISSDREVHAGVAKGTLVLWSEAFAAWFHQR